MRTTSLTPGGAAEPAAYNLYADNAATASQKPFKRFVDVMESWRKALGLRAVFVLVNASPRAIPAEVKTAHDCLDMKKKYAGAFDHAVVGARSDVPFATSTECMRQSRHLDTCFASLHWLV